MTFDARKLFSLLPPLHQLRDLSAAVVTPGLLDPEKRTRLAALNVLGSPTPDEVAERDDLRRQAMAGPLASLLGVLAEQIGVIEEDLEQLYDDQFIETCAEWVVPYIGDLIGYRMLHGVAPAISSPRAEVAHTIAFRRRKGTLAVLEELGHDVTGWKARAVEFFALLVTTQNVNHRRLGNTAAPDMRRWEPLERVGTAFDSIPRTVEVRRIASGRGRYNIPNVGIFLYRIDAQPLHGSPAVVLDDRRRRFHPLGLDQPLYTRPATEDRISQLATTLDVPLPISRRVLYARPNDYYSEGGVERSLALYVGSDPSAPAVPSEQICVCNLSDVGGGWAHVPDDKYAIDPELGRLTLPNGVPAGTPVRVDFHHGFGGELGGGEYQRTFDDPERPFATVKVPSAGAPTIQAALDALGGDGVVEIDDSGRYEETLTIAAAENGRVALRAANGCRPTLILGGELVLTGRARSEIELDGLLIAGYPLHAPATGSELARLTIRHSTLVPGLTLAADATPASPGRPSLVVETAELSVTIERSIIGPVRAAPTAPMSISDSIVDATAKTRVAFAGPLEPPVPDQDAADALQAAVPGGALTLSGVTVIGKVNAQELTLVTNSILMADVKPGDGWTAPIVASRRQQGCVRYSFVPESARVPRRYRCMPESASERAAAMPAFTSLRYGYPAYAQLVAATGSELFTAADDDGQPGAFHFLYQPQRETNLWIRLDEYLRTTLEAGVVHDS